MTFCLSTHIADTNMKWFEEVRSQKGVPGFLVNIQKTSPVIPHCLGGLVNTGAEPFRRCNPASFADLLAA